MLLMILMKKKKIGTFYKKELQKTNLKKFRFQKVIKRKGDKLCVKWKGYFNLIQFNSWIDKKIQNIKQWIFPKNKIFRSKWKN